MTGRTMCEGPAGVSVQVVLFSLRGTSEWQAIAAPPISEVLMGGVGGFRRASCLSRVCRAVLAFDVKIRSSARVTGTNGLPMCISGGTQVCV